jgi:hypothetical protein
MAEGHAPNGMVKLLKLLKARPGLELLGKDKLAQALKKDKVPAKAIEAYWRSREVNQMYSRESVGRIQKKLRFKINAPPYSFQVDVVLWKKLGKMQRFLLVVDIQSRMAFAYILKSNKMADVLAAYKLFLIDASREAAGHKLVRSVSADAFFDNKDFRQLNKRQHIRVMTTVAKEEHVTKCGNKLGIVDACVKTLKRYMGKHWLQHREPELGKFLPSIVKLYNSTPHSSLPFQRTPKDMYADYHTCLFLWAKKKIHNYKLKEQVACTLYAGDAVRVLQGKQTFAKEGPAFSSNIYKVKRLEGNRYVIEGLQRRYNVNELQKVTGQVRDRIQKDLIGRYVSSTFEVLSKNGKQVKKRFWGRIVSSDEDEATGRVMYHVEYTDGDEDDRFEDQFEVKEERYVPAKAKQILRSKLAYVGKFVTVPFGDKRYHGVITDNDVDAQSGRTIYHIKYEDGDEDDRNIEEFQFAEKVPVRVLATLKKVMKRDG